MLKKNREQTLSYFQWTGINTKGEMITDSIQALSLTQAKALLLIQGIKLQSIKKNSYFWSYFTKKSIKKNDIIYLTRQLATMLNAGIPILQCFDVIARSSQHRHLKHLLAKLRSDIKQGLTLHNSIKKHKNHFDNFYCALIASGEESGCLTTMLDHLAFYLEKTALIKRQIQKALTYPAVILSVGLIVSSILLIKVIPAFKTLFDSFNSKLPFFTLIVLNFSDWIRNHVFYLSIISTSILGCCYALHKKSLHFRKSVDRLLLKLPVLGPLINEAIIARFSRTLATTFAAGMPLTQALLLVSQSTNNLIFDAAIKQCHNHIIEGKSLHISLESSQIFPSILIQMVAIGEESGKLDEMLHKSADIYEKKIDHTVAVLSSLAEPLIMVILGLLVGGLVIAMYLPIFQLSDVIAK